MRISTVPAIFIGSFLITFLVYLPTTDAKCVFDFIDFIRSYHETGWNIYYPATHHVSPYVVSKVIVTSLYLLLGFNETGWHIVTCFIQAVNSTLLFLLLSRLLKPYNSNAAAVAATCALLFILVPYHTETLVWIGALNYPLVVAFILSSLVFTERYAATGRLIYLWWATGSLLLGAFSHEWGLFAMVAAALLLILLLPARKLFSLFAFYFGVALAGVAALYLLNQWFSGSLIAHYGADVHLRFVRAELVSAFCKYIFKIVLLSGFWPYHIQDTIFSRFSNPQINLLFTFIVLGSIALSLLHILLRKNIVSVSCWLYLCFVVFVFPVLNLYFPNWTPIMADRYCYLTSAFLLSAIIVLSVSGYKNRKWLPAVFMLLFLPGLYQNITSWHHAGTLVASLQKDFRWKNGERIYFLNMPDNFRGAYMLRSTFTSGIAAREIVNGHYYPRNNKMTDVAAFNLFTPHDSVTVTATDSSTLRVTLSNTNAWWWRNGGGCESYETEDLKLVVDNDSRSYTAHFKHRKQEDVFIYCANGRWHEVQNF